MPIMVHTPNQSNSKTGVPPIFMNADGNALTAWSISGQTVQNGTPAPDAPIYPESVGERTENLFGGFDYFGTVPSISTGRNVSYANGASTDYIPIESPIVTLSKNQTYTGTSIFIFLYDANEQFIGVTASTNIAEYSTNIQGYTDAKFCRIRCDQYAQYGTEYMLNAGATVKPYEPYGYKLPLTCGSQTTPVYLGQTQTLRRVKKLVLTGEETGWSSFSASFGLRFKLLLSPGALESAVNVSARSICTHLHLTTSGATYADKNSYTINAQSEINIARDETYQSLDSFKQWLATQYANGTPVCVWYVLEEPETGIVNEPLCKIGTYTDTVASTNTGAPSIITSEGYQNLTVDTTVQPSNVSVSYNLPEFSECSHIYAKTDGVYKEVSRVLDAAGAPI